MSWKDQAVERLAARRLAARRYSQKRAIRLKYQRDALAELLLLCWELLPTKTSATRRSEIKQRLLAIEKRLKEKGCQR